MFPTLEALSVIAGTDFDSERRDGLIFQQRFNAGPNLDLIACFSDNERR